ncbi:glycosyltransferase family 2 protein [Kaistella faecalis]|uniref:glycosyltransferase family 2 protein n=1 Tax=Kaistella faecalis TaxID=2852098 RepID=UPI001C442934|nr:glycosyltransferase family 2 protein [Chryseobacterium faecale]UFK97459.1 glycosyltransferase family 2 protein [Chryseobacterium faecale]
MKLAIVILNWNGKNWLEKFLPSVILYSGDTEIYVIDNASTDDSIDYLHQNFPHVRIIYNTKNNGFAGGYNDGLKHIHADIYCLLNSDVEVTANWFDPVLNLFKSDPKIAAVQPKVLDYNRKNFFEFAGAAGGFIDNLGYPYCRGRIFESIEEDKGQYNDETEIFWASGCCLFIRAEDFWNQKGFDERFFAHQEEIDLCWRLKNDGKKIFYTGKSTIYHVGGGTLNKQSAQKTFLNMRNNLTMLVKNLPLAALFWVIFSRLILDGAAALYFAFQNGFSHLWAVLRAHFSFYSHLPGTIRLRGKNQIKKYHNSKWLIFKHFI